MAHGTSSRALARAADEDAAAARRIAGTGGLERSTDVDVVDPRDPVHVLEVVIPRVRLQRLVGFGGVLSEERHADHARPRFDGDSGLQPLVDLVARLGHVLVRHLVVFRTAHRRKEHALAVHRDFELMRPLEPGHVADDVAQQLDAELVFRVERKIVPDEDVLHACRAGRPSMCSSWARSGGTR